MLIVVSSSTLNNLFLVANIHDGEVEVFSCNHPWVEGRMILVPSLLLDNLFPGANTHVEAVQSSSYIHSLVEYKHLTVDQV